MRLLRSLLWFVALGGLGIVVLLVLVQNLHTERLAFFGEVYAINFAEVLVGAAAFGFLLALVLIVPGRVATALYARMLDRELRQLEQRAAHLNEQRERLLDGRERLLLHYERLFADHEAMIAERERLRSQLAAAAATNAAQTTNRGQDERTSAAAQARQPLALWEWEPAARREVRAAPTRVATLGAEERRPASAAARAAANVRVSASAGVVETTSTAAAKVPGGRILPPVPAVPVAPDLPAVLAPPVVVPTPLVAIVPAVAPDSPVVPEIPVLRAADPTSMPAAPDPPVVTGRSGAVTSPLTEARSPQIRELRERLARYALEARGRLGEWRSQAGRMRRSAGAMYNDMRTTLLARARGAAANVRTPYAATRRDAAPTETSVPSTSTPAAFARDEDGHESTALKGEHPLWRPLE